MKQQYYHTGIEQVGLFYIALLEYFILFYFLELKGKLPRYLWRAEMDLADLVKVKEVKKKKKI